VRLVALRLVAFLTLAGCGPKAAPADASRARPPQVRFRPISPPTANAELLVGSVPGGQWDAGLAAACTELMSMAFERTASLDPGSTSLAAARAGFPGQARFARVLNGGAFPIDLVDAIVTTAAAPVVDLGMAVRTYADGTALWVIGWAPHLAEVDPLPRDLQVDDTVAVHVELPDTFTDARLYVAPPDRIVQELSLTPGVNRWVDLFQTPGPYRVEVVGADAKAGQVVLLFSLFVGEPPPSLSPLTGLSGPTPDPRAAEEFLYARLDTLRADHGLRPVTRFPLFEGVSREHSALMAARGVVAHTLPGLSEGVADQAEAIAHPRAEHFESVAAARSAEDALAVVLDSPGHRSMLLCDTCTHVAIGAALEPVLDRPPRLFVTWELLRFPQGEPRPIHDWHK